jgi:quercetin dioxygenase-like cupin family protein
MADAARVETLGDPPAVVAGAHARLHVLAPGATLPAGAACAFALADGRQVAFEPRPPAAPATAPERLAIDETLRANAFRPLHESRSALAALVSVAAGRRLESGPESERALVALRGRGLVFLDNGDALRFQAGDVVLLPAGEPARLWAQGPEDVLAVALQPPAPAAERRTLASELRRRAAERHGSLRSPGGGGSW